LAKLDIPANTPLGDIARRTRASISEAKVDAQWLTDSWRQIEEYMLKDIAAAQRALVAAQKMNS
jgi:hypothetical protein